MQVKTERKKLTKEGGKQGRKEASKKRRREGRTHNLMKIPQKKNKSKKFFKKWVKDKKEREKNIYLVTEIDKAKQKK